MRDSAKTVLGAGAIALVAVLGALLAGRQVRDELDVVRGARVALEARRALEDPARFDASAGELTIVRETESAKYPFLNKRSYVVNTASIARAGTVLRGTDPRDKARADRHAEVRRKGALRTRLDDGSWRVTIRERDDGASGSGASSTGASGSGASGSGRVHVTAELVADPPPVAAPWPWLGCGLALALGLALFAVAGIRLPLALAAALGVLGTAAVTLAFAEAHVDEASALASAYLHAVSAGAPSVHLPRAATRGMLGALTAIDLLLVAFALSSRGSTIARELSKSRFAYAAIAPAILGLGVLVGIPFLFGIGLSFFEHEHGRFTFVGLSNFARILAPPDRPLFAPGSLLYALFVNVVWTASNIVLHVSIGLLLALLLQRRASQWSRIYRVILIIPWAVPAYLTALIWKSMFDPDVGAVNRLLGLEGVSWMHTPITAFLANLITNAWLGFPFMMVVCLGALTSIPKDLYEAADVDGATELQQFARITLPLLQPALLPAVILGSIWTFNRFEVIYLVSEGRPDGATDILVTEAYRWAFERGLAQGGAYGYAAAYSVVIFLVLLVYGWMTSRVARAAEEALR